MRRDRLPILVVLAALLAVGLVGAALFAPSVTADSGTDVGADGDRTITVDATGNSDAGPIRAVALPAALGVVALGVPSLPWRRHPP